MKDEIEHAVRELVTQLLSEYRPAEESRGALSGGGLFAEMGEAVKASETAQEELMMLPLDKRRKLVSAMRAAALEHAEEFSRRAVEETGIGEVGDKVVKNRLAAELTPGVEDLDAGVYTDEHGMTLVERAPYGVIGAITPMTNPTATVINNGISMVSGGNTVVFNAHPSAKGVSSYAVKVLNDAIVRAGGPENVLSAVVNPTIESAKELMSHAGVTLLVVTGGPGVVKAAMNSGKKVIAAGPGNPPCVVDETAHVEKAGRDIVMGAGFDRNLVCICEKEVLVVESVADRLLKAMVSSGGYLLSREEEHAVTKLVVKQGGGPGKAGEIEKKYVGRSPEYIGREAGIRVPEGTRLLICDVGREHDLVWTEQLMPVVPVVRLKDVDECIELAVSCEHGYRHTAVMHSLNVEKLSKMAKRMNCSLFVKNGPCYAGLGHGGAGYTSFTIASPTGEGLTRARTFTRERRCTLVDYFRIV